jgi:hypothetical protein
LGGVSLFPATSLSPDSVPPSLTDPSELEYSFSQNLGTDQFSCGVVWGAVVTEPTPVPVSATYLGVTRSATITILPPG